MIFINHGTSLHPNDLKTLDALKEYPKGTAFGVKAKKTANFRSLEQLRLYWKCCNVVAENSGRQEYATKDNVDFRIRVALKFFDESMTIVQPDGTVVFKVRSIALKNLKHIEACNFFDRAFELMASVFDMSKDDFIKNVREA